MPDWSDNGGRNKKRHDAGKLVVSTLAMTDALAKLLIATRASSRMMSLKPN
jgi:hypothetical protein